jgi:hypothetical protein
MAKTMATPQSRTKAPKSLATKPQSRATNPQSLAEKPQSRAVHLLNVLGSCPRTQRQKFWKGIVGKSAAQKFWQGTTGWKACVRFLRTHHRSMCNTARHQDQLLHVNACSALMTGMQADVDWYIGGNAYVNLPTAVAEVPNGVYLAKTKWYTLKGCPDEEVGPETATASIGNLRWIGTR